MAANTNQARRATKKAFKVAIRAKDTYRRGSLANANNPAAMSPVARPLIKAAHQPTR